MPRKSKDGIDSVIPLNTRSEATEPPVPQQQKEMFQGKTLDEAGIRLNKLDTNRKEAQAHLEKKCDNLDSREPISVAKPITEDTVRDIEGALKSTLTSIESLNAIIDMLRHDLVNVIQNMEHNGASMFQSSCHLQVLLDVLREKGIISEEEMKKKWEEVVPARIEQLKNQS